MSQKGKAALHVPRGVPPATASLVSLALLALVAGLLVGPALFGNQALLPGTELLAMAPWAAPGADPARLPWNPLLWDAAAQFYPWRLFAARWIERGVLPLWNPHQFCGTPFLANSQSALLYPLNWLIYLPLGLSVTRAMALVAWLHLTLAGGLMFLWLRGLGVARPAAFTAGVAYMLSGFIITWLELPTFLSVACWLSLLFWSIHRLVHGPTVPSALGAGVVVGLTLLGGHLQIAFYCLLGAGLYGIVELARVAWSKRASGDPRRLRVGEGTGEESIASGSERRCGTGWSVALLAFLAVALGLMLAAPQLLPSLELSRMSHRVGAPTPAGYAAYVRYAMPTGNLITLFLPDFYGHPTRGDFWGAGNYAEYAGYVGVVSLFLACVAVLCLRRVPQTPFLVLLALLSLAMALGMPLNALLYFYVPGFSQSGSPARILVLFCFAAASLAGLGLDALLSWGRSRAATRPQSEEATEGGGVPGRIPLVLAALVLWGLAFWGARVVAAAFLAGSPVSFGVAWERSEAAATVAFTLVGVAAGLLIAGELLARHGVVPSAASWAGGGLLPALVLLDGWSFASGYNPTTPAARIYAETEAIRVLRQRHAADPAARIQPVNREWSLSRHPQAVLPPNAALALGLDDIQGYDSLFLGRYKGLANAVNGGDSSPPENGNIVFFYTVRSPLLPLLGARWIVTKTPLDGRQAIYAGEGVWIYENGAALPRALLFKQAETAPREEAELEALERLARQGPEALRRTLILPEGAARRSPRAFSNGESDPSPVGTATYRHLGPNACEVTARLDREAWLLVTDSFAPGWRAYVNGPAGGEREVSVVRGHFAFRAVHLPAGEHVVRFRYEPVSFRLGLYLAGVAWMLLAAWAGQRLAHRRAVA